MGVSFGVISNLEGMLFSVPSASGGESSLDTTDPSDVGGVEDTREADATELATDVEIESVPD